MSPGRLPKNEWLRDLLADQAMEGLDTAQKIELERLASMEAFDRDALEQAAALAHQAMRDAEPDADPMPASCREKLERLAEAFAIGSEGKASGAPPAVMIEPAPIPPTPVVVPGTSPPPEPATVVVARIGWPRALAAAAVAALAMVGIWYIARGRELTPDQLRATILAGAPDAVTLPWGDWALNAEPPEVKGVGGDVVWSDARQEGVMRFVGLPLKPGDQYQLWIIDAERGMEQRISGGIFDGREGELLVPIHPRLKVNQAAAFAVTIEKPGGVWVSDMKRRVVIAARPKA